MPVTAPPKAEARAADHPSGDPRFKLVDRTIKKFNAERDALLEVLNTAQEVFGFLSEDLMIYVAQQLRVPLARVYGVATFYHMFTFKPLGEHTCIVCLGTACYVKKSGEVLAALEKEYGLKPGQTTADKKLSLAQARCVGSCGLAPVVVMDGTVHGKETAESTLKRVRAALATQPTEPEPAK